MRRFIQIVLFISCMGFFIPSEAQLLDEPTKKVSDAAERTVSDKSAEKTKEMVGKSLDDAFYGEKNGENTPKPRKHYKFSYHYQMDVSSEMGGMKMDYFIEPGKRYMGMALNRNGIKMFMVFDHRKETTYSFTSASGRKILTAQSLKVNSSNKWVNNKYNKSTYSVTDLPDKKMLGFACTGKQIENQQWKINVYYTGEIEFNMMNMFNANTGKPNESAALLQEKLPEIEDSLMMYFKVIDKKDDSMSGKMTCTKLEKVDRDFDTDGYQSMN